MAGDAGKQVINISEAYAKEMFKMQIRKKRNRACFSDQQKKCNLELNLNLNAPRNIEVVSKYDYFILLLDNNCVSMKNNS